jgi:hypothetical protein
MGHFHGGYRGFNALISVLAARSIQTLLLVAVRQYTKNNRSFAQGVQLRNALGNPLAHVIKVSGFALNDAANDNYSVKKIDLVKQRTSGVNQLKRTGNVVPNDVFLLSAQGQ